MSNLDDRLQGLLPVCNTLVNNNNCDAASLGVLVSVLVVASKSVLTLASGVVRSTLVSP